MMLNFPRPHSRGISRGYSLVELMMAVGVSSLVMISVAYMQYFSGRTIKELYGQTRTRCSRMIALDAIRYRLMNARIGSCVVSYSNHQIQFTDPTLGGGYSTFSFNQEQRKLYYNKNTHDGLPAVVVASGPIDVSFQVLNAGEVIQISVRSASDMDYGSVDTQDGQTSIYLRNPSI